MAVCDILDLRCIFVNELIGSITLAIIVGAILFFVVASKTKMGFNTTSMVGFPIILIISLGIGAFSTILAVFTIVVGILYALVINRIVGNR